MSDDGTLPFEEHMTVDELHEAVARARTETVEAYAGYRDKTNDFQADLRHFASSRIAYENASRRHHVLRLRLLAAQARAEGRLAGLREAEGVISEVRGCVNGWSVKADDLYAVLGRCSARLAALKDTDARAGREGTEDA